MTQFTILQIALMLYGQRIPYLTGGNCPILGLDCSGFVCEVLRSKGYIGKEDYTAQGLYDHFKGAGRSQLTEGSLLFFGKSREQISHVAIAAGDIDMVESGGGDHTTTTVQEAIKRNAYLRIRPIKWRSDLVAVLKVEI